ncbi:MAG: shikimate dehydrogenase [Chloroflexota bacterium]
MSRSFPGRVGLIGDPVDHSLSPAFQQAAFDAMDIPTRYELWPTGSDEIDRRIDQLRSGEIYAANVTVPHKETFYRRMDDCSEIAVRAGAVNTILARDGELYGDNTDVHGFLVPLQERDFNFDDSTCLILGAGGAARGVIVALLSAGINRVIIANRTLPRAEALANDIGDRRISVASLDRIDDLLPDVRLFVNATALGWNDESPVSSHSFAKLPGDAIAYDLTYRQTPFLQVADNAGLTTIDGLPMLVHQGARSFEIWTGLDAPVDVMMAAAIAERERREAS